MDSSTKKKLRKRSSRKTIAGIKLPPIEKAEDGDGTIKTIVDVDPSFYAILEGRPVRPNTSIHLYKRNIRDVAFKRTLHGYLLDEILRIDKEIETEKNVYETASKHFDEYKNSFDKFLADDNNKTIAIMKKSDNMARDLVNQTEDLRYANYELASCKSKLQYTDETLMILLSFQNFLHTISPILWQEKENITLDIKHPDIFVMDSDIFCKIDIKSTEERLKNLPPPKLYFEQPDQLLTVFSMLEKQNLNYLLVTEELNSEKNKFLKSLNILKNLLTEELNFVQEKMKETEQSIKWNEIREVEIKELFFKILEKNIRDLTSSDTVLQIFNYVEFAYEFILAPNNTKLSSLDMMLSLEKEYDNLMLDISAFDWSKVKVIEKETYERGNTEIKQAKEAAKLLKNVDKLNKRLKSAFEPSRKITHD